jgi:hypothetical protein
MDTTTQDGHIVSNDTPVSDQAVLETVTEATASEPVPEAVEEITPNVE